LLYPSAQTLMLFVLYLMSYIRVNENHYHLAMVYLVCDVSSYSLSQLARYVNRGASLPYTPYVIENDYH